VTSSPSPSSPVAGCTSNAANVLVRSIALERIATPGEMADPRPTVVPYQEDFRPAFEQLNRDWIESYFVLEDTDRAVFADPAGAILGPGGQIFFVVEGDTVLGTCAVLRHSPSECEIAKMAVAPAARGRGLETANGSGG